MPPLSTRVRFWARPKLGPVNSRLPPGLIVVLSETSGTPDNVNVAAAAALNTPLNVVVFVGNSVSAAGNATGAPSDGLSVIF